MDNPSEDELLQPEAETLWQTVKGDVAQASGRHVLQVAVILGWMAFQWGWGNDVLLPPIVATSFDAVDDGHSWLIGLAAAAAATGIGSLFWAATQTIDVLLVLSGLRLLPGITARMSRFVRRQGWIQPFSQLSFGTKALIAYASGASLLCLIDVFATGQPGLHNRRGMAAEAIALAVATVAGVIATVTAALVVGSRIPSTNGATEVIVRFASNPLTWIAVYGSMMLASAAAQSSWAMRVRGLRKK